MNAFELLIKDRHFEPSGSGHLRHADPEHLQDKIAVITGIVGAHNWNALAKAAEAAGSTTGKPAASRRVAAATRCGRVRVAAATRCGCDASRPRDRDNGGIMDPSRYIILWVEKTNIYFGSQTPPANIPEYPPQGRVTFGSRNTPDNVDTHGPHRPCTPR